MNDTSLTDAQFAQWANGQMNSNPTSVTNAIIDSQKEKKVTDDLWKNRDTSKEEEKMKQAKLKREASKDSWMNRTSENYTKGTGYQNKSKFDKVKEKITTSIRNAKITGNLKYNQTKRAVANAIESLKPKKTKKITNLTTSYSFK